MFAKKPFQNLSHKTEKELLQLQTAAILESEKHLNRIKDNVVFFFYLSIIIIVFSIFQSL
jgi:hypothetical protein